MRRGFLLLLAFFVATAATAIGSGAQHSNRAGLGACGLWLGNAFFGSPRLKAQGSSPRASGASERQTPTFKSGVDLVTVTATVRDRKGRLVKGLTSQDFEVFDAGERRRITDFRSEPSPVSLAILFDISGSMRVADRVLAAKFAAHHVLSWLEAGRDEAALFTFDSGLHEVAPFTVDTRALQGALGEVDPFGATSLHDAIAGASRRAAERAGRRRAVVVITDGLDTASRLTPAHVSAVASAIDVPVYVLATVLPIDHPGHDHSLVGQVVRSEAGTVEDLANWSGGAFFYTSAPSDTSQAARQVIEELREQYVMAFAPAAATGWRPLEVKTRNKSLVVRTRSGYLAGGGVPNNSLGGSDHAEARVIRQFVCTHACGCARVRDEEVCAFGSRPGEREGRHDGEISRGDAGTCASERGTD